MHMIFSGIYFVVTQTLQGPSNRTPCKVTEYMTILKISCTVAAIHKALHDQKIMNLNSI